MDRMTMPTTILLLGGTVTATDRGSDWKAELTDDPTIWECGQTIEAAVGTMVVRREQQLSEALKRTADSKVPA